MPPRLAHLHFGSRLVALLLAGAGPGLLAESGHSVEIVLPADTVMFAPSSLKGFSAAQANCVVCHSTEYIRSQPPLSLAAWTAEVKKMKKVFGAPIADDQVEPIAHYLAETYGPARAPASGTPAPK